MLSSPYAPPCGAIPPNKWKTWRPKGALPVPRWYQAAASRLDSVHDELARTAISPDAASVDPPGDVEPSATSSRALVESWKERCKAGVQTRGQPADAEEELAALRHGRAGPSNFNLQRHAVTVCGRPVVVPIVKSSNSSKYLAAINFD